MIQNATITKIQRPTPNAAGQMAFAPAAAIDVRANVQGVTDALRRELGATIENSEAVLRVLIADLTAADAAIERGDRVTVTIDGMLSRSMEIEHVRPWVKAGGLSHYEIFLRAT